MKYIKKFENKEIFEIGDIVFYEVEHEMFKDYFKNNPGEIVDYDFLKNADYYIIHFHNLPSSLNMNNNNDVYIKMKSNIRKANQEEIKKYKLTKNINKYNL